MPVARVRYTTGPRPFPLTTSRHRPPRRLSTTAGIGSTHQTPQEALCGAARVTLSTLSRKRGVLPLRKGKLNLRTVTLSYLSAKKPRSAGDLARRSPVDGCPVDGGPKLRPRPATRSRTLEHRLRTSSEAAHGASTCPPTPSRQPRGTPTTACREGDVVRHYPAATPATGRRGPPCAPATGSLTPSHPPPVVARGHAPTPRAVPSRTGRRAFGTALPTPPATKRHRPHRGATQLQRSWPAGAPARPPSTLRRSGERPSYVRRRRLPSA